MHRYARYIIIAVLLCTLLSTLQASVYAGFLPGTIRALTYTVQEGDSLWSIAREYDTHVSDLKTLNNLKANTIHPGDLLFVPRMVYTVDKGDCLYSVAHSYGLTVYELIDANQLDSNVLHIGQQLLLPSAIRPRISIVAPDGTLTRSISDEEFDLLIRLVYAESSGESYIGKVAVAASVLNRVDSSDYPNTISDVINQVVGKNGYQYTPVANGKINCLADETSKKAVEAALAGWDPTYGATGFFNPNATDDAWVRSREVITVIGNHVFFI